MFLDKYLGYTFFARDLRMSGYIKLHNTFIFHAEYTLNVSVFVLSFIFFIFHHKMLGCGTSECTVNKS